MRAPLGWTVAATLLLSACSGGGGDAPGTFGTDDQHQLNDAAAMLDANSADLNAVAPDQASTNGTAQP